MIQIQLNSMIQMTKQLNGIMLQFSIGIITTAIVVPVLVGMSVNHAAAFMSATKVASKEKRNTERQRAFRVHASLASCHFNVDHFSVNVGAAMHGVQAALCC